MDNGVPFPFNKYLFGCNIATHRQRKGLTQSELASACLVSTNSICSIENGKFLPSIVTLLALCKVLEVSPNSLLLPFANFTIKYEN